MRHGPGRVPPAVHGFGRPEWDFAKRAPEESNLYEKTDQQMGGRTIFLRHHETAGWPYLQSRKDELDYQFERAQRDAKKQAQLLHNITALEINCGRAQPIRIRQSWHEHRDIDRPDAFTQ